MPRHTHSQPLSKGLLGAAGDRDCSRSEIGALVLIFPHRAQASLALVPGDRHLELGSFGAAQCLSC